VKGALLIQDHGCDGCDWLGHREDAEQRICIHWSIIPESVATSCFKVHDLSVSRDQRYRTYQIPVGNFAVDEFGDLAKPVGGQANCFGLNDANFGCWQPRGQQ